MANRRQDDVLFEQPFPTPEEQAPYVGKVVAFDEKGIIREAADTWEQLLPRLSDEALAALTLLYIPGHRFIA
jgi:hypothetical protein